jgi:hypothetical protein
MMPTSKTYLKAALIVMALIAEVFLIYGWMSNSVSLDHARQQQQIEKKRSHLLSVLLHKTSARLGRSELINLIERDFGNERIIKEEKDRVLVDDVVIRFEGQTVIGVTTLDDVTE